MTIYRFYTNGMLYATADLNAQIMKAYIIIPFPYIMLFFLQLILSEI